MARGKNPLAIVLIAGAAYLAYQISKGNNPLSALFPSTQPGVGPPTDDWWGFKPPSPDTGPIPEPLPWPPVQNWELYLTESSCLAAGGAWGVNWIPDRSKMPQRLGCWAPGTRLA